MLPTAVDAVFLARLPFRPSSASKALRLVDRGRSGVLVTLSVFPVRTQRFRPRVSNDGDIDR